MQKALKKYNIKVEIEKGLEVPEIQADSCERVASFSAQYAANKLNKPVIKADTGLFIDALNGLPGVYVKEFHKKLGVKKLLLLLKGEKNRNATIVYALAYCEPSKKPMIFVNKTRGRISLEPQGKEGMLIDYVFIPEGENKTMGELKEINPELRKKYWGNTEERLAEWLLKSANT